MNKIIDPFFMRLCVLVFLSLLSRIKICVCYIGMMLNFLFYRFFIAVFKVYILYNNSLSHKKSRNGR
jgi:hypothetical protein